MKYNWKSTADFVNLILCKSTKVYLLYPKAFFIYNSSFQMCIYSLGCYFAITGYFYFTLAELQDNTVDRIWNSVV